MNRKRCFSSNITNDTYALSYCNNTSLSKKHKNHHCVNKRKLTEPNEEEETKEINHYKKTKRSNENNNNNSKRKRKLDMNDFDNNTNNNHSRQRQVNMNVTGASERLFALYRSIYHYTLFFTMNCFQWICKNVQQHVSNTYYYDDDNDDDDDSNNNGDMKIINNNANNVNVSSSRCRDFYYYHYRINIPLPSLTFR